MARSTSIWRSKDGKVSVTVSDTGPGIPVEQREGLFERPFSSSGAHRGGGLGLLIVQRMLQLHHSQIRLIDRDGAGTCVLLRIADDGGEVRGRRSEALSVPQALLQMRISTAPSVTSAQATIRRGVSFSRMNSQPISTAKIELISRNADTVAIGR